MRFKWHWRRTNRSSFVRAVLFFYTSEGPRANSISVIQLQLGVSVTFTPSAFQ